MLCNGFGSVLRSNPDGSCPTKRLGESREHREVAVEREFGRLKRGYGLGPLRVAQ